MRSLGALGWLGLFLGACSGGDLEHDGSDGRGGAPDGGRERDAAGDGPGAGGSGDLLWSDAAPADAILVDLVPAGDRESFDFGGTVAVIGASQEPPPMAAATVKRADNPSVRTITAGDGTFALTVPRGAIYLQVSAGGWLTWQHGFKISDDVSSGELYTTAEAFFDGALEQLGQRVNVTRGHLLLLFKTPDKGGGYGATLTAAHDPSFVLVAGLARNADATPPGNTRTPILFPNVMAGYTRISLVAPAGRTCRFTQDMGGWHIDTNVMTVAVVECQ
jgi:hypothetical protein